MNAEEKALLKDLIRQILDLCLRTTAVARHVDRTNEREIMFSGGRDPVGNEAVSRADKRLRGRKEVGFRHLQQAVNNIQCAKEAFSGN